MKKTLYILSLLVGLAFAGSSIAVVVPQGATHNSTVECANGRSSTKCPPGEIIVPPQVIFSENFDAQADWFPSVDSTVCKFNGATSSCDDDVPPGWNAYRNVNDDFRPEDNPAFRPGLQISNEFFRGASGKSLIKTSESNQPPTQANFFSDGILLKHLGAEYQEIHLSFWIRFQPGWQWQSVPSGGRLLKIARIGHVDIPADGSSSDDPFTLGSSGFTAPLYIFDFRQHSAFGFTNLHSPRCDPQSTFYQGCAVTGDDFDYFDCLPGAPCNGHIFSGDGLQHPSFEDLFAPRANYADWHRIELQITMNSAPGVSDGQLVFWFDGQLERSVSNIPWRQTGSPELGFNMISVGGNWNNWYAPVVDQEEQWYAIDDLQVCTSRCP